MTDKYNPGVYGGSRVGYLAHEIENWLRQRVRVSTGNQVAAPIPVPENLSIIAVKEAERRTGFSRVHLWRLEKQGKFPSRIRLIAREPRVEDVPGIGGDNGGPPLLDEIPQVQHPPRLRRRAPAPE